MVRTQDKSTVASQPVASASSKSSMSVLKKEPSVASGKSNYAHGQGSSISDYNSFKSQEAMVRTQNKSTVASQPVASASSESSMSVLKKAPPVASGKSNYAHGQGSSISDYNSFKSQEAMVRTQDKSTVAS
jgi:hypothetical protein